MRKNNIFCIHHNAWTVHKGKDCCLKNQQEGASTISKAAKTKVNPNYHANSTTFKNPNTIQSFQAILA